MRPIPVAAIVVTNATTATVGVASHLMGHATFPLWRYLDAIYRRYLEIAPRHRPRLRRHGAPVALRREGVGPRHLYRGRADDVGGMRRTEGTAVRRQPGIQLLLRQLCP